MPLHGPCVIGGSGRQRLSFLFKFVPLMKVVSQYPEKDITIPRAILNLEVFFGRWILRYLKRISRYHWRESLIFYIVRGIAILRGGYCDTLALGIVLTHFQPPTCPYITQTYVRPPDGVLTINMKIMKNYAKDVILLEKKTP